MSCLLSQGSLLSPATLLGSLGQLADLLRSADDGQYGGDAVGHFACSLGEQVRHLLDHVRCLVAGLDGSNLDYDRRQRGTEIERDRGAAIGEIERLGRKLRRIEKRRIDEPCVVIVHAYEEDAPPAPAPSSLGRELAFVLSHTVHHLAVIGAMAAELGLPVPPRFGCAPSTLAHLRNG